MRSIAVTALLSGLAIAFSAACSSSTSDTGGSSSGSSGTSSGTSGSSGSSSGSSGTSGSSGSSSGTSGSSGASGNLVDAGGDAAKDGGDGTCGKPGDTGNSKGVGKYCKGIIDCLGNKDAQLCAVAGDPKATFCTKLCNNGDGVSVCGENTTCVCDPGGGGQCGCTPTSCL